MLKNSIYNEDKIKTISEINCENKNVMMDIYSKIMSKDECFRVASDDKEIAILLIQGSVNLEWQGNSYIATRESFFDDLPICLHVPKNVEVTVNALDESEILIQKTINNNIFECKLYKKSDVEVTNSSYELWDGTAKRDIITIFDYDNAPYSNMVMGEVRNYPGKWSSYIPHSHPHPEVYYYRFDKPQGFGACFIGDNAYKITDGSYAAISGGLTHPQVCAPGYRMSYVWMIRHLDGNPWNKTRIDDKKHIWLLNN